MAAGTICIQGSVSLVTCRNWYLSSPDGFRCREARPALHCDRCVCPAQKVLLLGYLESMWNANHHQRRRRELCLGGRLTEGADISSVLWPCFHMLCIFITSEHQQAGTNSGWKTASLDAVAEMSSCISNQLVRLQCCLHQAKVWLHPCSRGEHGAERTRAGQKWCRTKTWTSWRANRRLCSLPLFCGGWCVWISMVKTLHSGTRGLSLEVLSQRTYHTGPNMLIPTPLSIIYLARTHDAIDATVKSVSVPPALIWQYGWLGCKLLRSYLGSWHQCFRDTQGLLSESGKNWIIYNQERESDAGLHGWQIWCFITQLQ